MIEISQASLSDSEAVLQILNEGLAYKLSQGDEAWERQPWTSEEVDHSIASGNTYLGTVDREPAASFILIWDDERTWGEAGKDGQAGYLHRMAVANAYRGQQLGKQIVSWAAEQVRNHERKYLRLDCPAANTKLCSYYQSLGFQIKRTVSQAALLELKTE